MAKNAKEASDFLSEALLQLDNVLSGTSLFSPSYKTQDCIGYTSYTLLNQYLVLEEINYFLQNFNIVLQLVG